MSLLNSRPSVSVVIPVHNAEAYLDQCLESVARQDLEDIEVICIDDASIDGSARVVESFVQRDGRFKLLINDQNLGAGPTRNKGIEAARGDYVSFLDSDDTISPDALGKIHAHCLETDADICCCPITLWHPSNGTEEDLPFSLNPSLLPPGITEPFSCKEAGIAAFLFTNPSVCTKMFKRTFLEKIDARFTGHRIAEDLLFTYSAFVQTDRIAILEGRFYRYNQDKPDTGANLGAEMMSELVRAMDELRDRIVSRGMYETYRKALSNLFLYHCWSVLSLMPDAVSLENAFEACTGWKNQLQESDDLLFLYPHYEMTHRNICSGSPTSFLLDSLSDRDEAIAYRDGRIEQLTAETREHETYEKLLEAEIAVARHELDELLQSHSFRLGTTLLYIPSALMSKLARHRSEQTTEQE
ncbi:glycosyltransferase family 2 protein [Eggerthella guodeyinii]|uniref:Glycosyltransferase family 2 protein n=1 Tax=Eggerthella guodeyinii TaxID=2690837 RepID=A0A6L7IWJ1_9ACTN|nr:glycosyltransferase family 2 protein [Eggerthella guodeyinii]QOS67181.1 glycosyltransferase family 2 protein [Eggerthella guodeyinii]